MKRFAAVNLEKLIEDFSHLEQKITELKGKNSRLEMRLDEVGRLMKLSQSKEKYLREERDGLLEVVTGLHHTVQQQCDLRVENEKMKNTIRDMERQNISKLQESAVHVEKLRAEMATEREEHQRQMDKMKCEFQTKLEAKAVEMEEGMHRQASEMEGMRRMMKDQEREKQAEMIKLQMEFSAKLARVQSTSVKTQQQPSGSCPLPQNIFKRKLQFIQEERHREVEALRQRVRELEQQNSSFTESRLKRKKV